MSQPDLFVVCRNCGSEVSPYVTECPYCGQRVRKRAPKLERGVDPTEAPRRRRRRARLPRLRPDEIEGIAPDVRPWATLTLIAASLLATVVYSADQTLDLGAVVVPGADEAWRWFTAPFIHHRDLGYQFVALLAIGVFGTQVERRFGPAALLATALLSGAAGVGLAVTTDAPGLLGDSFVVLGGNGMALGLLAAWLTEDRLAARRGERRSGDLLGVYVFAAVLVLLSVAVEQASIAAAAGGAAAGAVLGFALRALPRS